MTKDRDLPQPWSRRDEDKKGEARVVPFQPRTRRPSDLAPTPPDDDEPLPPVA